MILYSEKDDHYSHRVRIVLAEKDIACEIRETSNEEAPDEVLAINPYHCLPILSDRDLGLYDTGVMLEYLDERFPHPPLFPVYPVARAMSRLWIYRIRQDWCPLVDKLMAKSGTSAQLEKARKELRSSLISIAPIFEEKPYFMSDEFTIVDCCVTPILWRLSAMGIDLGKSKAVKSMLNYRERLFERESVMASLSDQERELL